MTPRKNLPRVLDAVVFINTCIGEPLVRTHNRTAISELRIDFEIPITRDIKQPLNYALTRLWRKLGPQSRTLRSAEYAVMYEWDFGAGRSLVLMYTTDDRTIIRLEDLGNV
jgi:hypothetical protein